MISEMKPKPSIPSNSNSNSIPRNANEKKKKKKKTKKKKNPPYPYPYPFPLHQTRTRSSSSNNNNNNINIEAGSQRFSLSHSSIHSSNNKPTLPSNNNLNLSKNSQKPPGLTCTRRKKNTYKNPRSKTSDNLIISTPFPTIQTPPLDLDLDLDLDSSSAENANKYNPSTTPPVQPSLSPELLLFCGSSSLLSTTTTPASCYGAGHHVFSGISDKRKCRPRGLLAVRLGDKISIPPLKPNNSFSAFDSDDNPSPSPNHDHNLNDLSSSPLLPLPAQASLHWLSPPSSTQNANANANDHDILSLSPSDIHISINSPSQLPHLFQEDLHLPLSSPSPSPSKHDRNSPFSIASSDSGNVIRTPPSDSSSAAHIHLLRLSTGHVKENNLDYELSLVAEALRMSSLSPNSTEPVRDGDRESDIIDTSFQFECLATSCSSVFLSQVPRIPDDHQASWNSCSTTGNESQMRISWRDQAYEMDEFDCCRCLSDDDDNANGRAPADDVFHLLEAFDNDAANTNSNRILTESDCSSSKIVDNEMGAQGKGQEDYVSGTNQLPRPFSCAESISTDGGGLLASADSDWGFCYKNELFQE